MKKIFTLFLGALCFSNMAAQQQDFGRPATAHKPQQAIAPAPRTGLEDYVIDPQHADIPVSGSALRTADEIGTTFYDLQSNSSDINHIVNLGNGDLRAIWTFNKKSGDGAFADRGTAYTRTASGAFPTSVSQWPKERIESVRTGFTSIGVFGDGTEFIVAHRSNGTGKFLLHYSKRAVGATAWTEGDIPTAAPNGLLWARSAVSGSTVHVIAITTPTAANVGGVMVNGINGEVRYFRSSDYGASWDKQDILLPGLDSTVLRAHGADSYVIDADGDNVAIGIFPTLSDVCFWKSTDGGGSFAKHTIYKVPLKNHLAGDGYTIADIDTAFSLKPIDNFLTDSLAVWSSDENGSLRIDALGKVHLTYGGGWMNGGEANTTGGVGFYPSSGGINYWNESMPEDTDDLDGVPASTVIGFPIDHNNDGAINIDLSAANDQYNGFGRSYMASQPTIGLGDPNTVYVAYTATDERFIVSGGEAFSHVHIIRSNDNGQNWEGPYDLNNVEIMADVEIAITETAFPYLARDCGDKIHLLFQQDNVPGSFVTDNAGVAPTGDDVTLMKYLGLDPNLVVASKEIARPAAVSVQLSPNPANEFLNIDLSFLKKTEHASVSVLDMNGRLLLVQNSPDGSVSRVSLPVGQLPNGLYSLTVRTDSGLASRKFSVIH